MIINLGIVGLKTENILTGRRMMIVYLNSLDVERYR